LSLIGDERTAPLALILKISDVLSLIGDERTALIALILKISARGDVLLLQRHPNTTHTLTRRIDLLYCTTESIYCTAPQNRFTLLHQ
jgi:uncharacterized membrane protein YhhN